MAKNTSTGPGRPSYNVRWPYNKFTFNQLLENNGVNLKTGKGKNCSRLTLFKHLQAETKGAKSLIVKLKDQTREPNSKKGLGRKAFIFIRRDKLDNGLKTAKRSTVTVKLPSAAKSNADYEAQKLALATPTAAEPIASEPVIPTPAPIIPVATVQEVTAPMISEPVQELAAA